MLKTNEFLRDKICHSTKTTESCWFKSWSAGIEDFLHSYIWECNAQVGKKEKSVGDHSKKASVFCFFGRNHHHLIQNHHHFSSPNRSSAAWARSMERHSIIQRLADAIFEGFVKPDGGQYLSRTGTIVNQPSLRVRKTRKAFALVRDAAKEVKSKRFWTKACFRQAVGLMMKQRGLEVPMTSGFSWQEWLKEQVCCLHDLAQKARRNQWRNIHTSPTLPWNPEEPFWGLTVANHTVLILIACPYVFTKKTGIT